MNNYTEMKTGQNKTNSVNLTWDHLKNAHFNFNLPFHLELENGSVFFSEQVLRILPKQRLTACGYWQNKPVVIKIFFNKKNAAKKITKEYQGMQLLKKCNTPTPEIYYQGKSADQKIHVLIFERLIATHSLFNLWQDKKNYAEMMLAFKKIMIELATQHVFGILYQDLHFKNFLVDEQTIYTVDGTDVKFSTPRLDKQISMKNVALFLSQFGVGFESLQEQLFRSYAEARAWLIKEEDLTCLFTFINQWYKKRWKKFAGKIFRTNSQHEYFHYQHFSGMIDREAYSANFENFLKNPDEIFNHPQAMFLKKGRSSTIIKVTLDNKNYVIKRYNLKNTWHRLRRCFRTTRAAKSWKFAQKFTLFQIETPKPVAYIEEKWFGLRGKSYYINEYIPGGHAGEYFNHYSNDVEKSNQLINAIISLLTKMTRLNISHGDLKISNFLVDHSEKPVMIDFDGMKILSFGKIQSVWNKEIKRFMLNFTHHPFIAERFNNAFKKIIKE